MTMTLSFRLAGPDDSAHGAALIMLTLREFGDHFFGFGSHERALQVVAQLFGQARNRFSHQHAILAHQDGDVLGLLVQFTARSMRRTWLATALQLMHIYRSAEMLSFIKLLLHYRSEERIAKDELYIAHLAVYPQAQRSGFGQKLLAHAAQQARAQGLPKLSLLTELENQPAINLYHKAGFQISETIHYPAEMHYLGSIGSLRMVKHITTH